MISEGFRFASHFQYDEVNQLLSPAERQNMPILRIKVGQGDEEFYMAVPPLLPELNLKEAHCCMYLLQHVEEFGVDRTSMNKKFTDSRAKCRMTDAKILFYAFYQHVPELYDSMNPVVRGIDGEELTMEIRRTLKAFT